jgi:hypothetical protein
MLNTDAHNPLAERRLGQADFVAMCHQPLSECRGELGTMDSSSTC